MKADFLIQHSKLLYDSYRLVTGKVLLEGEFTASELADKLYEAPFVVLSHGAQSDPVFNYANKTGQRLWEMNWEQFTALPSRLSAEPVAVAERQAMLEEAHKNGYISNYTGVRISSTGKRFIIKDATLWNIYNASKQYQGQAVIFTKWVFI
ncbi:MEKHLA domain-containing protein [Adhaeribacter aquaticus]|uniref:MEKHLA domain-containing protein n=1 Tax=Adhaeribacter aquaticus TaxID=299567 RepID=UPI000415C5E8|nr:MEKHLA domain-containing protein [Adhaeribacter aquaticus]